MGGLFFSKKRDEKKGTGTRDGKPMSLVQEKKGTKNKLEKRPQDGKKVNNKRTEIELKLNT